MVKIRLTRTGAKNNPHYRVVVTDSKTPRDGRYVALLGWYDPRESTGKKFEINVEAARNWLAKGAQPTESARSILKQAGVYAQAAH
ncbi:MAG: 30S ribosomal protein S16 [Deinococcus sp.]|nr:30S ribosomal protein S16 [Deinococcus sp.]